MGAVQFLTPAIEQAVVSSLLDQDVFERIGRIRWRPAAKDQLGRNQPVEGVVQSLLW